MDFVLYVYFDHVTWSYNVKFQVISGHFVVIKPSCSNPYGCAFTFTHGRLLLWKNIKHSVVFIIYDYDYYGKSLKLSSTMMQSQCSILDRKCSFSNYIFSVGLNLYQLLSSDGAVLLFVEDMMGGMDSWQRKGRKWCWQITGVSLKWKVSIERHFKAFTESRDYFGQHFYFVHINWCAPLDPFWCHCRFYLVHISCCFSEPFLCHCGLWSLFVIDGAYFLFFFITLCYSPLWTIINAHLCIIM